MGNTYSTTKCQNHLICIYWIIFHWLTLENKRKHCHYRIVNGRETCSLISILLAPNANKLLCCFFFSPVGWANERISKGQQKKKKENESWDSRESNPFADDSLNVIYIEIQMLQWVNMIFIIIELGFFFSRWKGQSTRIRMTNLLLAPCARK